MSDLLGKESLEVLSTTSFRDYIRRVVTGLKQPKESGEYSYARFQLQRVILPFATTVVFCAGMILSVSFLNMSGGEGQAPNVTATVIDPEKIKLDLPPDEIKPEKLEPEKFTEVPNDVPVDVPQTSVENTMGGTGPLNVPGIGVGGDSDTPMVHMAPVMTKSPQIIKGLYGNRTKGGRQQALSVYNKTGNSAASESAVLRALNWLKRHQDPDGSWRTADKTDATAMAGLALLCFLAHNETPSSAEFGQTVENAMKYIVSKQDKNGSFGREYTHGICTYALCEGFALTKIMALRDAADKGLDVIIKGQQPQGGYNYKYEKGERWDLSVAGWQFQAMKAAKMAGLGTSQLDAAIKLGSDFLRQQAFAPGRGGFGYSGTPGKQGTGATPSMTGAGVLCLQLLGFPNVPEVRAGLEFLKDTPCAWTGGTTNAPKVDVVGKKDGGAKNPIYAWYYITQAKFQSGGKDWDRWNSLFSKEIVEGQEKDGHWDFGDHGGPVYSTTLCCLMLEVYYRYLPTYKHAEEVTEVKAEASDDVVVEVN